MSERRKLYRRALGLPTVEEETLVASGGFCAPLSPTFIHLDGGKLDLGIVRDSVVNSSSDYEVFAEVFEP